MMNLKICAHVFAYTNPQLDDTVYTHLSPIVDVYYFMAWYSFYHSHPLSTGMFLLCVDCAWFLYSSDSKTAYCLSFKKANGFQITDGRNPVLIFHYRKVRLYPFLTLNLLSSCIPLPIPPPLSTCAILTFIASSTIYQVYILGESAFFFSFFTIQ